MKRILGISAFYHDSAASLIIEGKLIAAAQEERFTRIKNTSVFPKNAIKYCLEEAGLEIDDLDAIVFYDKPLLKFERLLETYFAFTPRGLMSFLKAMPVWLNEKLFFKKLIYTKLKEVGFYHKKKVNLLFSEHHLSHAASSFFTSKFETSAILTIDGVGEWCTTSISIGEKGKIKILKEMEFPNSVGLLYSAFTYYLGFKVNSGEYKVMGLAPYGNFEAEETLKFIEIIKSELIDIKCDGSIWLNQNFFDYATGLRMIKERRWEKLFGFKRRELETEIEQKHCNFALAAQKVTEEIILKMAIEAKRITSSDFLCLSGGVALNCVANGKLLQQNIFKEIFIQPAAGDAGGAIGAALAVYHMYFNGSRVFNENCDQMLGSYLGPDYSEKEIQLMNKKTKSVYDKYDNFSELAEFIAEKLSKDNIVGWFQGRMEFGPRALGNRSILGDARNPLMQKKINIKIKNREGFRPFASSVLSEDTSDYFDLDKSSPYMLFVAPIIEKRRKSLPTNYNNLPILDRLYYEKSDIPSITHLDFSTRIQTVHKKTNPRYWQLINAFKNKTGVGLIINTSFNVRGEPIVCSPFDAYRCFMDSEMDYLVIGDFVYCKLNQPNWEDKRSWGMEFKLD